MKTAKVRNTALGLIALAALTIYILACTSFSPDDTKVLYPAFDEPSGKIGIAVYDRETRRSDMLLVPFDSKDSLTRAAWLPDGRQVLVFWSDEKGSGESMKLALVPVAAKGPVKVFEVPGIENLSTPFAYGIGFANQQVFLVAATNRVVRLNLKTGAIDSHEIPEVKDDLVPLPAPGGAGLFYLQKRAAEPSDQIVFGRMNPETFALTPTLTVTNQMRDESFIAYNEDGTALAFVEKAGDADRLVLARKGKPVFTLPLESKSEAMSFGSAGFSAKGDAVWATFGKKAKDGKDGAYGFMEIPFSQAPIRETLLITNAPPGDMVGLHFQGSVSHDGKTAAIASTYLATGELKPADCALFFIDLADPNRKVTRVPIPMPSQAQNSP